MGDFFSNVYIYGDSDVARDRIEDIKLLTKAIEVHELDEGKMTLHVSQDGLALEKDGVVLKGDFLSLKKRFNRNNLLGEMIVKAVKIKGSLETLTVVDATAGMGEDSMLLAAAGFNVHVYEYDPIIAALLKDSIARACLDEQIGPYAKRMTFHHEDSIKALKCLDYEPDVVLLDPMFPERQKSGLIKKKFQLIQQLEAPCVLEESLLEAAIMANPKKIVIKRPLKGPYLAGRKPDYSINGKAIRYDCILLPH